MAVAATVDVVARDAADAVGADVVGADVVAVAVAAADLAAGAAGIDALALALTLTVASGASEVAVASGLVADRAADTGSLCSTAAIAKYGCETVCAASLSISERE